MSNEITNAKIVIDKIKIHNEQQKVLRGINAPLIEKLKVWYTANKDKEQGQDSLKDILDKVGKYIDTGEDLEGTKNLVEKTLIDMTNRKSEELNEYNN